ncbi:D-alanyl-D-alanine endopeptidase [Ferrigenium sp. UT5]|uniref:D-alanyl-D-alanine endopeptidase n=1 Tax=Ferrigenium sp. UT5 TaxID=3242105 RepID=UPI00354C90D4
MKIFHGLLAILLWVSAGAAQAADTPYHTGKLPKLGSAIALIYDEQTQQPLYRKNENEVVPIASITKLMTAMVVLDARLPLDEPITITREDRDRLKGTKSRLRDGMTLSRGDLLALALMASENRAASALARTFPGGTPVLVALMNAKARELGMDDSSFTGPAGLQSENVSTAQDLVKLVQAAETYPEIRRATTQAAHTVQVSARQTLRFGNTNPLVRSKAWDIGLSKTGYISEAGRCLVMKVRLSDRPTVIVLLDSWGKHTRVGDANRIKNWVEGGLQRVSLQSRMR